MIVSINPTDGRELARYELHSDAYVDQALSAAANAQRTWRNVPVEERCELLRAMARALRAAKPRYAAMITREMGKPVVEAEAEIEKCAYNCDFYADNAPKYLADEAVASNATESVIAFDPLGVVLAIMPWNYPFWQFFRKRTIRGTCSLKIE
jgi:succinate-semialdehyde dehydrogenase/glutarate-semialdehyde dehydrogenase